MHSHSDENGFNLQVNENSFSYERMDAKTLLEKEAKNNSILDSSSDKFAKS